MRTYTEPNEVKRISDWLRRWLEHRYLPWHLAMLAMLLCAPSLCLGWQCDDDFHRLALTQPEGSMFHCSPAEVLSVVESVGAEKSEDVEILAM